MSDTNRTPDFVDDEEDLSLEETSAESSTNGTVNSSSDSSVSSDEMIAVARIAIDRRLNQADQMTNETINQLIVHVFRTLRMLITTNEFLFSVGQALPWIDESVLADLFNPDRAERLSHEIAHPWDASQIALMNLLSNVLVRLIIHRISNDLPFGIQDTQAHTMEAPTMDMFYPNINVNYENGATNEDATTYADNAMNSTTNDTGDLNQIVVTESTAIETSNGMTNINIATSADTQGDNCTDINSHNEMITEDHTELNIDQSQTSPRPELSINHEDDEDDIQTNIPTTPIPTPNPESSQQAAEIVPNLAGPSDNNTPTHENPTGILAASLDKPQLPATDQKQLIPLNAPESTAESESIS